MRSPVEKRYSSRQTAVIRAERLIARIARKLQFSEGERADVAIAITEAVNNAVEHGNRYSPDKQVFVRIEFDAAQIRIVVRDEGDGFDLEEVADPLEPENLTKPDGRGLLILRSLMDTVDVRPSPDGTEVVMVKKR